MIAPLPLTALPDRVMVLVVLSFAVVALIVFLVAPIFFVNSLQTPFIGAFVGHTLMVEPARLTRPGGWELSGYALSIGHQVQAINGQKITRIDQFRQSLSAFQPGERVVLTISSPTGSLEDYSVILSKLPVIDQISYFVVPYLIGLLYFTFGLYILAIRRYDQTGQAVALFSTATALTLALVFDLHTSNRLTVLWTISLALISSALFNLSFLFPESRSPSRRTTYLRWSSFLLGGAAALYAIPTIYNLARPTEYIKAWRIEYGLLGLSALVFLVQVFLRRRSGSTPVIREQARLIFWGALVAILPLSIRAIASFLSPSIYSSPWLLLPLIVFPLITGYALLRYRQVNTDFLFSQSLVYAMMSVLAISGYALIVGGLTQIFGEAIRPNNPIIVGILVFIFALVFTPVKTYFQQRIDAFFYRSRARYRELRQSFSHELTQAQELDDMTDLLRKYVGEILFPDPFHLYMFDPQIGQYLAQPDDTGKSASDIRFSEESPLVNALEKRGSPLFLAEMDDLPEAARGDQARVSLHGAQLYLPLLGRNRLIGWMALGSRRAGEAYDDHDLEYLKSLADQAALAVERAQVVVDLERRVREMNVLTRVAQGVSFTVVFDDILELIYAQTYQVLPTKDFRITLLDQDTDTLVHAFYLINDERLKEKENKPVMIGQGLEAEVVKSQRALVTDDYERECRGRGFLPDIQGVYAWLGVPMNAGAVTIGALSLGSRDPSVLYTSEQLNLFQAIADQASGAIVKARLLEETERRAHQLAKLNEIGTGLTSNLDVKLLMNQILVSAVEIINCQAGSLFLVDAQTGEIVFEVVLGPVAAELTGKRLPSGTGLVGQAIQSGKPLIANDAKRHKEWFEKTDLQTGFDTQDLLVVPMRVQDRVIGAVEVINKQTGAPFTVSDQELLMAFTSQATVAIENARLYTMTDQELAARVEELSVMQRIDRELNASLEIERAMRITLDWALRQSGSEAGFIANVEPEGLKIMASQGYGEEITPFHSPQDGNFIFLSDTYPGIAQAIREGQPQRLLTAEYRGEVEPGLLPGLLMQIAIPIRRETETIGLLVLESAKTEAFPEDLLNFLSRLSDHAAIAIANAQLYGEVREANLAKSQFVSFVAHELKNPMASIKGYTELVASGMAGPITEMQTGFLSTVRSNVDRMNTIVTDLNDLTKIQVGALRLEFRALNLGEIIDEVIRSLTRQIEEKELPWNLDIPEDLPPVWADPSRLTQVLTNLISNAIKYTPHGSGFSINVERWREGGRKQKGIEFAHVAVQDKGIGISDEDQKKIFQQYFRTDTAKDMASGTGLGLNITKSLVEMQGGKIWFESQLGQGSTFHFTIPLAETT